MLKGASINADATPEYLGVGYIIGPQVAGIIFAGGVFSWLVLMPLIYFFGKALPRPGLSRHQVPIAQMGPSDLWSTYIRPMGAGAVAAAGLITLFKTLPTIFGALTPASRTCETSARPDRATPIRTEHDLSMAVVLVGSRSHRRLHVSLSRVQAGARRPGGWLANLAASLLVVVFGFLFVTVSSRIVGLIGSSASPVSGMTIATLMATSAIFLVKGWTAPAFGALAITIGGVVCIAASNAGDTSQDLKTGYLIGATPCKQQMALMIGVVVSTVAIGVHAQPDEHRACRNSTKPRCPGTSTRRIPASQVQGNLTPQRPLRVVQPDKSLVTHHKQRVRGAQRPRLHRIGRRQVSLLPKRPTRIEVQWIQGIGSEKAAAPQARLMATVINGILSRKLPWGLVMLGVFLVIAVELLGIRSLSFAVGAYLSIGTTLAIFCGGVVRWMVDRAIEKAGGAKEDSDSEISPGSLYASGLIAAGGLVGLLGVALKGYENFTNKSNILNFPKTILYHDWVSVVMFALLAFSLYYFARKPLNKQ